VLLEFFGEAPEPCGNCDLCTAPARLFDATEPVRKALSAVLRTGESFGAGHLIDILTGNATEKVRQRGHDRLPTFAVGKELPRAGWQAVFRQMMGRDLVRPDPERHGALRMTEAARPVLRGEEAVHLREDSLSAARARPEPKALVADEDAPLLAALKAHRRKLAEAAKVPPYVIFNDRSLIEMAEKRPATLDAFAGIIGVGATKLERYGASFLEVITQAAVDLPHPARRKLAGGSGAGLFDLLEAAARELERGADRMEKPLSCTPAQLARIARDRPRDLAQLERILGDKRAERFGPAFLEILREAA
jgi:ATP-dependent DNA helicase RecQ